MFIALFKASENPHSDFNICVYAVQWVGCPHGFSLPLAHSWVNKYADIMSILI